MNLESKQFDSLPLPIHNTNTVRSEVAGTLHCIMLTFVCTDLSVITACTDAVITACTDALCSAWRYFRNVFIQRGR